MHAQQSHPERFCVVCGRRIEWRKKWERDWESVKYCAKSCRSRGLKPIDEQLERAILDLLDQRSGGASICPSEAAKAAGSDGWRDLMEDARMAARRLVLRGEVEITQRGHVVDPSTAKGPIRVRRARTLRA